MIRFIHIKKNAGTSVYKWLRKNGIDFVCGGSNDSFRIFNQHVPAKNYRNEDSWKFCVVRNPYSRVVSFYNWYQRLPKHRNISFEEFVKLDHKTGRANDVWNLQKNYIVDDDGTDLIDKIFYFENIENEIKEHFEITDKFPYLNKSTIGNYRDYYNDTIRDTVYRRLKADFEYLGYRTCLT